MKRTIRRTVRYPHPPSRVWAALTSSAALAKWLMPNDFRPEVGHEFTFRTEPAPGFDGIVHCKVLEMQTERRMLWSWRGGPIDTIVEFRLEPDGNGTTLHFEQRGFEGLRAVMVSLILAGGFKKMYRDPLPAVLDAMARGEDFGDAPVCKGTPSRVEHAFAKVIDKLPS